MVGIRERLWKRAFGERSWISKHGDFRAKEQHGLIRKSNYLYGMLRAADCARYFGKSSVTAIEFGVASGNGLLNMVHCADLIKAETGITTRVVGFDNGAGLPEISGPKDHPEIWNPGDFTMEDRETLMKRLAGKAEIIWGDVSETVGAFSEAVNPASPIGFISVDVDIYSSTKSALRCLTGRADTLLSAVSMYFDDVSFFFANEWCGELAAIAEFNDENKFRKIGRDRSLPGLRPVKAENWYQAMYVCHALDHPARQRPLERSKLTIGAHSDFMKSSFLF